ncbi:DUF1217 domain-containing protein [Albibacillus kandeliae]|uniref:DUF1217 domain-containing protein n=1 Tax=Albibacillus kandeliae TaxID=2174228 RepID=UPI000D695C50|nr:DUF1217 domain-containing protein [Albibacillus kandeliae]
MSYQPVVAGTGLVAWRFLQRTYNLQFENFQQSAQLQRHTDYFLENISKVKTAEDLVSDRQLLSVALGAFGLQDDLDNKYFLKRVLGDGTSDPDALANRLADDRYRKLSEAFRLGPGETPTTGDTARMRQILADSVANKFEVAVGDADNAMRVALYAQHALPDLAADDASEATLWYRILGSTPLREFFQTALGLPDGMAQMDLEKQVEILQQRTPGLTGADSVAQFSEPEALEKLTNLYLVRSQLEAFQQSNSPLSIALQLLQTG